MSTYLRWWFAQQQCFILSAEDGKYEQAYQVAELANELAPENPETVVALKVARRQWKALSSIQKNEAELETILAKLEHIEKILQSNETKNQPPPRMENPYLEPLGSPDRLGQAL